MTKCVLIVQLEIPQIPNNLLSPSAQIGQLFGIFFERIPHRMSIVHIQLNQAKAASLGTFLILPMILTHLLLQAYVGAVEPA